MPQSGSLAEPRGVALRAPSEQKSENSAICKFFGFHQKFHSSRECKTSYIFRDKVNDGDIAEKLPIIMNLCRSCDMATAKRTRSAGKSASKTVEKPANGDHPKTASSQPTGGLEEMIRVRAYELYVERGFQDGYAQDDWLRAEAEVRAQERRN